MARVFNAIIMRTTILAFFLFTASLSAQTDTFIVTFALDTFGIDSFFLVQRDSSFSATERRAVITERSLFFQDTAELSAHISLIQSEYTNLAAQRTVLSSRYGELAYRIARLQCLRDSVFTGAACSGIGARMVAAPPPEEAGPPGFWVVYPSTAEVQYVYGIEEIKRDAVMLYPSGVSATFKKPKAAHKKTTPKKKKK